MAPKICLICGDKGLSNALVYCVNCLEVAVHRYCLDEVTFSEFVHWVCDDCEENEHANTSSGDVPPITDLVENSHVVQPVPDPIWRGRFNIINKVYTLDGVVAHLSIKASQSVSEKAKLLLLYLHFDMVAKSDLWPQSLNTPEATTEEIELYFFPSEARHEQVFNRLVEELIDREHALQAFTPQGELLVFSSTELPLRHWRYNQKRYLWGIFRATQGSSSRQLVANEIQSGTVHQIPENQLADRDEINVVNDRIPAEVETQVLRRGKRNKIDNVRLAEYDRN